MKRPVVGVIGNAHRVENRFNVQGVGERNLRAVAEVAGALPLMFAGAPDITDIGALLEVVDGMLLTGARANVHPTRFRTEPHPEHEPYDESRDAAGAGAGRGLRRRGRADVRRLPRLAGDERRLRRHAASRDPRVARAHEPSHAAPGERRDPSRSRRHLRRPPRRQAGAGWRLRPAARPRDHPRQLAAWPGHPRARRARRRRGRGGGRHHRGDPHRRRAGLCAGRAMACRARCRGQPGEPRPVSGVWCGRCWRGNVGASAIPRRPSLPRAGRSAAAAAIVRCTTSHSVRE